MEPIMPEELKKNPLFESLDLDEIRRIIGFAERNSYAKGDFVFSQDAEARKLYVIEEGLVNIILQLRPDRQLTIATEAKGGAFGWAALLPPHRHGAAAKCLEPCQLLEIDGNKLRGICYQEPILGVKFMEGLARFIASRLQNTNLAMLGAMWQ
jgi:CRP-like cAMP-binding protein